jgi:drug/metabolite transporter (DMT)-like permease
MQGWRLERRKDGAGQEDEMPDLMHWSAALLAMLGLYLWLWSGAGVSQPAAHAPSRARRKRQLARLAIFAAAVSALLQAVGGPVQRTELQDIEIWASAAPADARV